MQTEAATPIIARGSRTFHTNVWTVNYNLSEERYLHEIRCRWEDVPNIETVVVFYKVQQIKKKTLEWV